VKGKKSMRLQSEKAQCLPRSGNSGVPIQTQIEMKLRKSERRRRNIIGGKERGVVASSE
jgi:hypothetical protein